MKVKGNLKDLKFAEQVCIKIVAGTPHIKTRYAEIPWQEAIKGHQNEGVVEFICSGGIRNEFVEKIKEQINGKYTVPLDVWEKLDKLPTGKKYKLIEEL